MQTSTTQQRKRGLCALLLSSAVLTLAVLRLHRSCRRTLAPRASSDGASRPQAAGRNVGHRAAVTDRMYDGALHTNYVRSLQLLDPERLPPFTHEVQHWIWERQNPPPAQCAAQKYLLGFLITNQGLGSALHTATIHLAVALEHGYVFLWRPNQGLIPEDSMWWLDLRPPHLASLNEVPSSGEHFVDPGCGGGVADDNIECLLVPLSVTCGVEHLTLINSLVHPRAMNRPKDPYKLQVPFNKARGPSYWEGRLNDHYAQLGITLTEAYHRYWWRTQGLAYVLRPNANTTDVMRQLRHEPGMQEVFYKGIRQEGEANQMPYPLPAGTISMHIRHSDKGIDMTLLPFTTYGEAAERMVQHNPLALKRLAFVTSEDPDVIRAAQSLVTFGVQGTTPDEGWVIYTSAIPRENVGPHQQMNMFGRSHMSALWLLQLWLAVECDAWFGQRASNWNRMIDEMRCVLVDKCDKTFVELSPPNEWNGYLVHR